MSRPKEAPYGSWKSPIVASSVAVGSVGLEQIVLDGDDVYWIERRPSEGGRQVIVRLGADGERSDVTPPPFNARTRIHGYGGQAYTATQGAVYFSNYADGRLYRQEPGLLPTPITPEGAFAYGEPVTDRLRGRLICVREDYAGTPEGVTASRGNEPVDEIVAVKIEGDSSLPVVVQSVLPGPLGLAVGEAEGKAGVAPLAHVPQAGRAARPADDRPGSDSISLVEDDSSSSAQGDISAGVQVLVHGSDFYAAPCLSPDGKTLAWLAWNHPNMPWDGTELWVGEILPDGTVGNHRLVAGGPDESVFQPEWSPDGMLYFVSDRSGWWNLYRWHELQVEPLHPMEAEFGVPAWVLGLRTYGLASTQQLVCIYCEKGRWWLGLLDTVSLAVEPIRIPYTDISGVCVRNRQVIFIAGSSSEPSSIIQLDLATRQLGGLRQAAEVQFHPDDLSTPEAIEFPTTGGVTAHALFYPPHNRKFVAPADERPPLLVMCHGGPTGAASTGLSLSTQFWTSRGFAVVHVNYGGSTGYGRAYRRRLDGGWGVVDVEDSINAARHVVARGMADGKRLTIHGSSAGGYTALCALTFHDLFQAGAIYYGIGDLEALAQDTHKFESRYELRLVGPYPERRDLYRQRSPLHVTDRLSCALILFHGLDDRIVPPSQSAAIYRAVRQKGLPVAYMTFEGEGHGFRRADTIRRSLEAELYFFSRVFGFKLAEPLEDVDIENLG